MARTYRLLKGGLGKDSRLVMAWPQGRERHEP